jgi:hypothetical protein
MIGIVIVLSALLLNPFFIIKQPPSFVEFSNLLYIKFIIIIIEFFFLSIGILFLFRPERISAQVKYLNPACLYHEKKKELALLLITIITCFIILDLFSRFLLANANGLPFSYNQEEMIYPALHHIQNKYTDEGINVLLLGGSVLFINAETLQDEGSTHSFNFYNAANIAHTSLDSVYKYNYLIKQKLRFDYVIFYHGINDVRLNNIPAQFYQENYSHYYYYKLTNKAFDQDNQGFDLFLNSTLGYNFYHLSCKIYSLTTFKKKKFIPYDIPVMEMTKYGNIIKTEQSFRNNIKRIVKISKIQKATLIAPYFAFQPAYVNTELTRIWGEPQNVVKGIKRHNEIIAEMQDRFITINTDMLSVNISNFEDVCHFTDQGQKIFSELIIKKILFLQQKL